ncbi:hypothetical protein SAMN05216326_12645 [Nitrosomonas marina]|uniref:Uncharacterized protein n=1 Tax=Nitrosomonas marina TaxID=917 RepID=A0A1I0ED86_9PROT|nr:hypothetical protein SAMN05216326_12645 [Nitrosomonas marina]
MFIKEQLTQTVPQTLPGLALIHSHIRQVYISRLEF